MSKIEECYDLFKKYCKQDFIYFASLNFYDDESGEIKDDNDNILFSFDSFEECINILKEKLNDSNKK